MTPDSPQHPIGPVDSGYTGRSGESRQLHEILLDHIPFGVFLLDPKGKPVFCNQAVTEITGFTLDELGIGRNSVFAGDSARAVFHQALEEHKPIDNFEFTIRRKNGETAWLLTSWKFVRDEDGNVQWIHVMIQDISERKRMEESLQDTNARYHAIFEQSGIGIGTTDLDGRIVDANPALARMVGYSQEELRGKHVREITHPDDWAEERRVVKGVAQGVSERYTMQKRYISKEGQTVYVRFTASAIPDSSGAPKLVVGIAEDITQQKLAELAVGESEQRFRLLAENASDLIWQMDTTGILTYVSPSLRSYGYEPSEWIGHHFSEFLPEEDRARFFSEFAKNVTNPGPRKHEARFIRKDGTTNWTEVIVDYALVDGKPVRLQGISRDIDARKKAQDELQRAKQELQTIMDSMHANVGYKDAQGRFVWVNEHMARVQGVSRDDFVGKTVAEAFPGTDPEMAAQYRADDLEVIRTGVPKRGIIQQYTSRNGMRWVQTDKVPRLDQDGNPTGVILVSFDITDLKNTEQALRESEERFRMLAENASDLIWLMDQSGVLTYVSASARNYGYEPSECLGHHFTDFLPPEDRERFRSVSEQNITRTGPRKYEARVLKRDGTTIWSEVIVDTLFVDGRFVHLQGISRDITERKLAREELQRTKHEMQTILDSMPAMVFYKDTDLRCIWSNESLARSFGFEREWIAGKTSAEIHPEADPELIARYEADDLEVIRTGVPKRGIIERVPTPEGQRWCQTDKVPFLDSDGDAVGVIGITIDITDIKQMEEAIRESEERYRLLFSLQPDAQLVFRLDTLECLEASPSACELYGYTKEEFRRLKTFDVAVDKQTSLVDAAAIVARPGGFTYSRLRQHVKKDGTEFPVDLSVRAHVADGITIAHVSVRDITDRMRAQQAIEETSAFNRAIISSVGEGIAVYDKDLIIVSWNPQMEAIMGLSADSVIGHYTPDVIPYISEQGLEPLMRRALAGEYVMTTDVAFSVPQTGKSGFASSNYMRYRNSAGEVIGMVESMRDTTIRRSTEIALRTANADMESLYRTQRELLHNVAHEVRTPLTSVQGYTSMLLEGLVGSLAPEQAELLRRIKANCAQLVEMVNEVLSVAKVKSGMTQLQPTACNPMTIVERIVLSLSPQAEEKHIGLTLHREGLNRTNLYDELKLRTVASNLISNAVKFTNKGDVDVYLDCRDDGIRMDIIDTGIGIEENQMETVFEEFRQLPYPGRHKPTGFGIGLSLVASLVIAMEGTLTVSSEPGIGTAFSVWIPSVTI